MNDLQKLKWRSGFFGLLIPIPILIPFGQSSGIFKVIINFIHLGAIMFSIFCTGLSRVVYLFLPLEKMGFYEWKAFFMILNGLIYFIFGYLTAKIFEERTKRRHVMGSIFILLFFALNTYFISFGTTLSPFFGTTLFPFFL